MSAREQDATQVELCREEIIDAAERCVFQNGLRQLRLRDVARECGMSLGNLYNYFQNKEAIVEALVMRRTRVFLAMVTKSAKKIPGEMFPERIRRQATDLVDAYMSPDGLRLSIFLASEALVNKRLFEISVELNNEVRRYMIELLQQDCNVPKHDARALEAQITLIRADLEGLRGAIAFNPGVDRELLRKTAIERLQLFWICDQARGRGLNIRDVAERLGVDQV